MKKHVKDLNCEGKRVIVRVDFNVPLKDGAIRDDNRIVQALPTIKELINKGAKVILMSHLGKISFKDGDEKLAADMKKNNMAPVAKRLAELLGQEVVFCPATRGEELKNAVNALKNGQVLLMQNTRYEKGETKNNPELAQEWASLGDAFVMDAFGSAHRAHCSTVGVPEILKNEGKETAIGYLIEKEINGLGRCVDCKKNERPYIAILGGAKISDKIQVIDSLLKKCDKVIIGGGMSYTFKYALGKKIGKSLCEPDQADYAKKCLESGKILLPVDTVIANDFSNPTDIKMIDTNMDSNHPGIPDDYEGLDIGDQTIELFKKEILGAKTIFWNGPMGVFENEKFQKGTIAICEACAEATKNGAFSVIGGGDSAAAAKQFGYAEKFSHVSTGGGASLEMIQFDGKLPGIDVIEESK